MSIHNYQIDPPSSWENFERMCHLLWMDILEDPNVQFEGRKGQKQNGVDVYGTHARAKQFYGVQCKGKDNSYKKPLTEKELKDEVKKAKKFSPRLDIFILATTSPNDVKLQKLARDISEEHRKKNLFEVFVYGWDELRQRIALSPRVIKQFYPHLEKNKDLEALYTALAKIPTAVEKTPRKKKAALDTSVIKTRLLQGSMNLLTWPRTLKVNDSWIERGQEEDIYLKTRSSLYSTTLILGEPGTGKSALLSKVAQTFLDEGKSVLAIKADHLDVSVANHQSLSENLKLPSGIIECIEALSKKEPVYVLIDQLDALSEFVDVKTSRLSVLLNLIRDLNEFPNVHVIASSRPFEYRHDLRLSSIDAHKIVLPSLEWPVVEKIVQNISYNVSHVDDGFKNFLCRPNNLNFYLSYLKKNPQKYFQSHIDLYEDIWNKSLGDGEQKKKRADFMARCATDMTNEARQNMPIVRYEDHSSEIDWLCSAGLMVKGEGEKSFSFSHQTFQAFVWTRSFVKGGQKLSEFVLARQNSINIRPHLHTSLIYLREADLHEYDQQVQILLRSKLPSVRRHVAFLVIGIIGAQQSPTETEKDLFGFLLQEDLYQNKVLRSIERSEAWFSTFKDSHIPSLMTGDAQKKRSVALFLSSVVNKCTDDVLALASRHWMDGQSLDELVCVLNPLKNWTDQAIKIAGFIVKTENLLSWCACNIASAVSVSRPEEAPELVAKFFISKFDAIKKAKKPKPPASPKNASIKKQVAYRLDNDPRRPYEEVLRSNTGWYELEAIAEASPEAFITNLWPILINGAKATSFQYDLDHKHKKYLECGGLWFTLSEDDRERSENYLSASLEKAMKLFASSSPDKFIAFSRNARKTNLMSPHRLLAKGFCAISEVRPAAGLEYLLEDVKRLNLGSLIDGESNSTLHLIRSISPHLKTSEIGKLEQYIFNYDFYDLSEVDDAGKKKRYLDANRQDKYVLLKAIVDAKRSQKTNKFIQEQERAYGEEALAHAKERRISGLVAQRSPMSEAQLEKAQEKDIIKCLEAFTDDKERVWIRDLEYYGAIEMARAFAQFAGKNHKKALKIVEKLGTKNTEAVGMTIDEVAKIPELPLRDLLRLIEGLTQRGFSSMCFYNHAASAINKKIKYGVGLNDKWCRILEGWLSTSDKIDRSIPNSVKEEKKEKQSILWRDGRMRVIPQNNYTIVTALTYGYLWRKTPAKKKWLALLMGQLDRNENLSFWLSMCSFTLSKFFGVCSTGDRAKFINALLSKYPEIANTSDFGRLIARACHHSSEEQIIGWLEVIRTSGAGQLYGELLSLRNIIVPKNKSICKLIDKHIKKSGETEIQTGLAYGFVNIFREGAGRDECARRIVQLAAVNKRGVAHALLDFFRNKQMPLSADTQRVLDAFIKNKTIKKTTSRWNLPESLAFLVRHEPARVLALTTQLVEVAGKDFADMRTSLAADSSTIMDIALTLHNLGPEYQSAGLDLFEHMLEIEAYQAKEVLREIDGDPRPVANDEAAPRRRRKRRVA